eukprot:362481-Hanusia_phi.AAC.1
MYIGLWMSITSPRMNSEDDELYIHGNLLFFSVVLVDVMRVVKAAFFKPRNLNEQQQFKPALLLDMLDRFLDGCWPSMSSSSSASRGNLDRSTGNLIQAMCSTPEDRRKCGQPR